MLEKTLEYFRQISKIPRCSWNEKKIAEFLIDWAKKNNYEFKQDKNWNVLIVVPATNWMEKKDTIVLQGHMDMVCVKWDNSNHNFCCDEINVNEKDWFLKADNTTLWADNGIWIAIALTLTHLDKHSKLELFFTVDEEKWMSWALNIESNFLSWKKLLNIDSESENEITISSAGWARIKILDNYNLSIWKFNKYYIEISWLKWWHSWIEIDKSKWNSVDCLMLLLKHLWWEFEFYDIESWIADNVIPKKIFTTIWIKNDNNIKEKIESFKKEYIKKFDEDNLIINLKENNSNIKTIWTKNSKKIIDAVLNCYSWVYSYSKIIKWFVQTSQNLWIIKLENWELIISYLIRSSNKDELEDLIKQKNKYFWEFKEVVFESWYPGWEEKKDSKLLADFSKIYKKTFWKNFKILWCHAWLECWAIISKMPTWSEAISIWPNIFWAHTIDEKCEIKSIGILLKIIEEFLNNL